MAEARPEAIDGREMGRLLWGDWLPHQPGDCTWVTLVRF
jgi:hypothetical protein